MLERETLRTGSSPLSRGILYQRLLHDGLAGIIPALAGNTQSSTGKCCTKKDHPRSRGEYCYGASAQRHCQGSSPLSRGIPLPIHHHFAPTRIIPALAGNTWLWIWLFTTGQDHPRSRGEYHPRLGPRGSPQGSSPLSRGIPQLLPLHIHLTRIIPALAGNTTAPARYAAPAPDHPRSRGEYDPSGSKASKARGSSPLSRGIQIRQDQGKSS